MSQKERAKPPKFGIKDALLFAASPMLGVANLVNRGQMYRDYANPDGAVEGEPIMGGPKLMRMRKGGKVGKAKKSSPARRADGIAKRGHTKGKFR